MSLVRHPQTDWNRERRYQSRSDRPLTAFGQARAEAIGRRLQRIAFTSIMSSGLQRTDAVAELVAAQQRRPITIRRDHRWREADHGLWEGLTYPDVAARYSTEASERFADPWDSRAHGGESIDDLWERVEAAWHDVLHEHDGSRILIVTHATPIQLLLCALLQLPFDRYWQLRIDPGGITNVDLYPSGAIVRMINEVPPIRRVET
jgi:alpha-ribazole phosphatase